MSNDSAGRDEIELLVVEYGNAVAELTAAECADGDDGRLEKIVDELFSKIRAGLSRQSAQGAEAVYVSSEQINTLIDDDSIVNAYISRQPCGDDDIALYLAPPDTVPRAELEHAQDILETVSARLLGEGYESESNQDITAALHDLIRDFQNSENQLEQYRKDAERYRWLRSGDNDEAVMMVYDGNETRKFDHRFDSAWLPRKEKLDEAIDRAMQEAK